MRHVCTHHSCRCSFCLSILNVLTVSRYRVSRLDRVRIDNDHRQEGASRVMALAEIGGAWPPISDARRLLVASLAISTAIAFALLA